MIESRVEQLHRQILELRLELERLNSELTAARAEQACLLPRGTRITWDHPLSNRISFVRLEGVITDHILTPHGNFYVVQPTDRSRLEIVRPRDTTVKVLEVTP
jgi:hypothetical protein